VAAAIGVGFARAAAAAAAALRDRGRRARRHHGDGARHRHAYPVTKVQVGTYVSGPIIALDVDFNSTVTKGQRVAKIDPASFQVKVLGAEANLANARARVEKSRADLALKRLTAERFRELREKDFISQNDLDTARSSFDQARAQLALDQAAVQQSNAELQESRINLAYTDINSPVDGVVVSRNVDVGQTVAASFQTPTLFEIAQDLTKMQVDANVSESDIGAVKQGQGATFAVDAYPGREFSGAVVQVRNAPITVQNVVTYDVVIAVDNPTLELKPGMTATVTIVAARRENAANVPTRALNFHPPHSGDGAKPDGTKKPSADGEQAVWRLAGDDLERVEVTTGLRDEQFAEVVSGALRDGDRVAVALRRDTQQQRQAPPMIPGMPRMR
jgi:HlyD family secretion protein